ncbi:MAG: hypothetical protein HS100_19100 [Anaerolineales bacterium]|nr:hypothetical protein [Anaerolineales bacterium]
MGILIVDWKRLSTIYLPSNLRVVKKFRMRRIFIRKMGFPLGLDMRVNAAGLFLLIPWIFRFGLPAIFIPWKELKPVGRYKFWLKPIEFIVFSVKFPQETQLMIPSTILYNVENCLPKNFMKDFRNLKWIIDLR